MSDSFLQRLVNSFESNGSRIAMRIVGDDSSSLTFSESLQLIRRTAKAMETAGIQPADRVVIMGDNHPFWAISYLSVLFCGAIAVPIDPQGEMETVANFFEDSEAKLAFIDSRQIERFSQIEEKLGRKTKCVVWQNKWLTPDFRITELSNGFTGFDNFIASAPEPDENYIPRFGGDDVALLIYTSGTTGKPKGVPLTHGNILAELDGINEVLEISSGEKILSLLPLFHAYLQIVNLWVATTYGCEVGYLKELSPNELAYAMKEFRPTILTTVPRLWYLFHKKIFDQVASQRLLVRVFFRSLLALNGLLRSTISLNPGRLFFARVHNSFGGSLRLAVSAGSRFDENVAKDFHRLGFTILQGYGLTETSGAATATYANDNRVGTVGKPLKGAEIRIADPNSAGIGEVQIRGPIVFKGYYHNQSATAEAFTSDGWFRSGDLGKIDKSGHLRIVGRAKDVIVLPSGKNVHPEDLEIHYLKAPEIEEIAIIGITDTEAGHAGAEKLAAVIVPDFEYLRSAGIANSREAVRFSMDSLGRELPEYQRVREYIIRTEPLPRTATRKIKRFQLKEEIDRKTVVEQKQNVRVFPAEDSAELLSKPAARLVFNLLSRHGAATTVIHPKMNLEIDLGLDSLARAEFFAALEEGVGTTIDAEDAARLLTVEDVIQFVELVGNPSSESSAGVNWSRIVTEASPNMPEVTAVLKRRPLFTIFAFVVYKLFNLFCRIFMLLEVTDREKLQKLAAERKKSGQTFIICPNHQSFLDPFVLCSTYPFEVFANIFHVGASEFFRSRLMSFVAAMLKVVPIDPDTQLLKAMKAGAAGLKCGKILNIYPEGERAFDGKLHQFKKGAAILSSELVLPILPVAIDGLYRVWPRGSMKIRPAKVRIKFGEPIYPQNFTTSNETNRAEKNMQYIKYERLTYRLRSDIEKLLEELR